MLSKITNTTCQSLLITAFAQEGEVVMFFHDIYCISATE